jgi:hypothetical protein
MTKRCIHEPIRLFDQPRPHDECAAIHHFLSGYTKRVTWVICRRCGDAGYWGGYGARRRVRWGYGDNDMLLSAEHHNRVMAGRDPVPKSEM